MTDINPGTAPGAAPGPDGKADASDYAYAQMLHNTDLATWLVRMVGKAALALLAPTFAAAALAGYTGEPGLVGVGSLIGVVFLLVVLTGATAPIPSALTVSFLTDDDSDVAPPSER